MSPDLAGAVPCPAVAGPAGGGGGAVCVEAADLFDGLGTGSVHALTAAFLRAHAPWAWSRNFPWHVTVSVVVLDGAGRVLLGRDRRWGWKQFGGHVEGGDVDLAAAARRELAEEAGPGVAAAAVGWVPVLATPFVGWSCLPGRTGGGAHLDVCFRAVVPGPGSVPAGQRDDGDVVAAGVGPEGTELGWWSLPAAGRVVDAGCAAMIAAAAGRS